MMVISSQTPSSLRFDTIETRRQRVGLQLHAGTEFAITARLLVGGIMLGRLRKLIFDLRHKSPAARFAERMRRVHRWLLTRTWGAAPSLMNPGRGFSLSVQRGLPIVANSPVVSASRSFQNKQSMLIASASRARAYSVKKLLSGISLAPALE
jgi:hypothetical protein